ncbi:MAG: hypothetical protein ACOH2F_03740 [Cellulomonas sp.]
MTGMGHLRAAAHHLSVAGVALCLVLLTACTGQASRAAPDAAAPSSAYTVPAGAPELCSELTDLSALMTVPDAVSTLVSTPGDATATEALAAAGARATAIAVAAGSSGQYAGIGQAGKAVADQVAALATAPVTADAITQVAAALDALGAAVQPVCGLPT